MQIFQSHLFFSIVFPFLGGVATALLFPITPTPEEVFSKIWGYIQTQTNDAIVSKDKAKLTQDLATLTVNLNHEVVGYLAQLQILDQTPASLAAVLNARGGFLSVPPDSVDLAMKGVDTMLSSSLIWYSTLPLDVENPDVFVLASTSLGTCLHSKQSKIVDGTELVMDNQCDLNILADKMFSLGPDNRLIMRTSLGLKCVAYSSKRGDNVKKHLAIFDIKSSACQLGRPITVHRATNGVLSMFDGLSQICVNSKTGEKNLNSLITAAAAAAKKEAPAGKRQCLKGSLLYFDGRIAVPLVSSSDGGATGSNIVPAISFEELRIQLFYFPKLATIHLLALKEMHAYGTFKEGAKHKFFLKVNQYKLWLEKVIPIITTYSTFMGIDSSAAIQDAQVLLSSLPNSTLEIAPAVWTIPNNSS